MDKVNIDMEIIGYHDMDINEFKIQYALEAVKKKTQGKKSKRVPLSLIQFFVSSYVYPSVVLEAIFGGGGAPKTLNNEHHLTYFYALNLNPQMKLSNSSRTNQVKKRTRRTLTRKFEIK